MAHYCDVETQNGGGCRRRVNAATCKDHVNGPVPRKKSEGNWTPLGSRKPLLQASPYQASQTETAPADNTFVTLSDTVAIVQQLPRDWKRKIAEQSAPKVGLGAWEDFLQKQRTTGLCLPLARTARELLDIKASVGQLPGDAAAGAARRAGAPPVVQAMAAKFASGLGVTGAIEQKLAATAHTLRVLGVFACAITDAVPSCQCLRDLVAENMSREEFESRLWHLQG
ncbi:hypothetical protein [Actinomadura roseirufa]|uniref:hypothetical protein n=1 Tax=Actinomadura roseirufa TaxID=2094049 RepID=UPI001040FECB|nr:hypothetical protein [Actinomadura roseirufa]